MSLTVVRSEAMLSALVLLGIFAQRSVTTGIITFGVGIIVGVVCVLLADRIVRGRLEDEHAEWVRMGRPERRGNHRHTGR